MLPNAVTPSTSDRKSEVCNETDSEKDEEAKVKLDFECLFDPDIKIIGEAFVTSLTMGVSFEWQENVNEEEKSNTARVALLPKNNKEGWRSRQNMFGQIFYQGSLNNPSCITTGIE